MYVTERDELRSVYHVIARKQGNPSIYYHRQWIDSYRWTAWTKIDLDILSDHVLPVVWNRRLYLFWAIINQKPDKAQDTTKTGNDVMSSGPADPESHLEVQLAWSEYKGNKWLAKQTSRQKIVIKDDLQPQEVTIKSTLDGQLLRLDIFAPHVVPVKDPSTGMVYDSLCRVHHSEFALGGIGNAVEAFIIDPPLEDVIGPDAHNIGKLKQWDLGVLNQPMGSKFEGMAIVSGGWEYLSTDRQRVSTCHVMYRANGQLQSELVASKADFYRLLVPHQFKDFDSSVPFFYEDTNRTYFLIPSTVRGNAVTWTGYKFVTFYHAFVPLFIRELNRGGVDALFSRDLQLYPAAIRTKVQGTPAFDEKAFGDYYLPANDLVLASPGEGVDFESYAGYAIYNWELFFHAPFMIGESLSHNQLFEEAKHWYEYIFNPTSATDDAVPKRYWVTKPFYYMADYQAQSIRSLMNLINKNDRSTIDQVNEWRSNPFDPHIIAQMRPVAYQRAIVMKYIDNLIAWGDRLFSQDTMESVNEATQMYVLAAELLGPKPEMVKPLAVPPDKTYAELEAAGLDDFANACVLAAENLLGPVQSSIDDGASNSSISGQVQGSGPADPGTPKLPMFPILYFNIPPNYQLLDYWDTVADRLFKIRHCMNIQGVKRQLALFAPPIDPGLLVKAAAAGLDLGSILSDMSASLPPYRFRTILQEAIELCEMVRGFGNELLGVLEKRDAEALAIKRSGYEKKIQEQIRAVMQRKLDEAIQQIDVLAKQRQNVLDRQLYYSQRKDEMTNDREAIALILHRSSIDSDISAIIDELTAGICNLLPNFSIGINGTGGTPSVTASWGGSNMGSYFSASSSAERIMSAILQTQANLSQTLGSYQRRKEDWGLQYSLATDELNTIDSQSLAAAIRQDIAQKEMDNHDTSIQMATDIDDFLHSKYTNQELYEWMVSQTSATYFQAYQLAYTLAKRAEQCFRHELGLSDSSYIQFGYWDSLKKGLLAGDKLLFDLLRLKSAYHAQNARELELTKHISLLAFDPYALVELRSKGECMISLPEILFDLENPGHFMRRIKSVGITVPCVVGPYTGVSMTLTLLDNHVRVSPDSTDYAFYPDTGHPGRLVDDQGGVSAIVTSSAQNDRGMFELRLDDERYLPFECGGAVSSWKLRLNPVYPQFDYRTISDVVIHLQYTARDGGETLRSSALTAVQAGLKEIALAESRKGLYRLFSARHEFAGSWQKFLNPGSGPQMLKLEIAPGRFPFFTNGLNVKITGIDFFAKFSNADDYTLVPTLPDGTVFSKSITLKADSSFNGLHDFVFNDKSDPVLTPVRLGSTSVPMTNLTWSFKLQKAGATDFRSLTASEIEDLLLVIQYEVS